MSRCFITQQVPLDLVTKYKISQAGVNFCNNIVNTNVFDQAFAFPIISVAADITDECKKDSNYTYIQFRKFPHKSLGKLLNLILENLIFVKQAYRFDHIWFYNVTNSNVISFVILKNVLFKKVYVLMADFRPGKKWSVKSIIKRLINNSDGIISLSSRSVFSNRNFICIPGIVPRFKIYNNIIELDEKIFLLSGVLKEETGLKMAIDVFKRLPHIKLFISGIMSDAFSKEIDEIPNIEYLGYINYEEYTRLVDKIAVGLSFRDPSHPMNNNNFPSKILEYFSLGKIVVSTIDYPEISKMNYFTVEYNCDVIVEMIDKIYHTDNVELQKYMNHSDFLMNNFSESAWIKAFNKIETK